MAPTWHGSGETAFVFAAQSDAPNSPLVFLPEGAAASMRSLARTALRCPVQNCPAPAITTVDRSAMGHRSGYRHLNSGVHHEPESFAHLQAKAAVIAWARSHPDIRGAWPEVDLGLRRPDVLLELADGSLLAVEIQYSGLTLSRWRERSASYQELDVGVVWLWGHLGEYRPQPRTNLRLSSHQNEQARNLQPVLWINPEAIELGWALGERGRLPVVLPGESTLHTLTLDGGVTVDQGGIFPERWPEVLRATEDELARRAARLSGPGQPLSSRPRRQAPKPRPLPEAVVMTESFGRALVCDVCKFPISAGQPFRNGRHEVCAYLL